ncbi:GumC family protein [Devosia faecipullorum]|uniref:GumC family protein n=1 Tax=Devosia faecipullorum TaxID=2755039 RepID=UPI00187B9D18|nr:tyrosine-protein kinase domain-containing protein [Devosia faecipullorum]MBE7732003.1 AAA family ATPase [Devosia faecipullorum]
MEAEIDLRAILGFLGRQLRLILAVFLAVLVAASALVFAMTPLFTATTLVMVDPYDRNLLLPQNQLGPAPPADVRVEGEVLLARSDNVLLTVIERENLVDSDEFGPDQGLAGLLSFLREPSPPNPEEALRQTLRKLDARVSAKRHRGTFLLSISASSVDPDRAALLANAVAKAYIDTQVTAKIQSTMNAHDVLRGQVNAARESVIDSDGSFDSFIDTNLDTIIRQTGNAELADIHAEIGMLAALRQSEATEMASLQMQLVQREYAAFTTGLADAAVTSLERERQELLDQLERSGATAAETDLQARLAQVEDNLQSRGTQAISDRQAEIQRMHAIETSSRQSLRTAILSGGLSRDTLAEIYDLQQQAELARRQYDQLMARSQQLQAESALQLADSRVVSPALRPGSASFPNIPNLLLLAAAIGLAAGIIVAFLCERFVGGITSDDQLAIIARTKTALPVPRAKKQPDHHSIADLVVTAPISTFSEAIRRIRTTIDHTLAVRLDADPERAPIIMVTSAAPLEGKTTMALALARSYAQAGRNTLLIDCDLRRPALHDHLGVEASEGLTNTLKSGAPLDNFRTAMTEDRQTGLLTLIGSRASSAATDQLVAGRNFDRLLNAAAQAFEIVVLDTPPLGPIVDGTYIARKSDVVLMVVNWASTAQQDIRKALLSLEAATGAHTRLIPVLNQQKRSAPAYSRRSGGLYADTGPAPP